MMNKNLMLTETTAIKDVLIVGVIHISESYLDNIMESFNPYMLSEVVTKFGFDELIKREDGIYHSVIIRTDYRLDGLLVTKNEAGVPGVIHVSDLLRTPLIYKDASVIEIDNKSYFGPLFPLPDYNYLQMIELQQGLMNDVNPMKYDYPNLLSFNQMREVKRFLEYFNASEHDESYNKMYRLLLKPNKKYVGYKKLPKLSQPYNNSRIYIDNKELSVAERIEDLNMETSSHFSSLQMEQIFLGFKYGLTYKQVRLYSRFEYTSDRMKQYRLDLMELNQKNS